MIPERFSEKSTAGINPKMGIIEEYVKYLDKNAKVNWLDCDVETLTRMLKYASIHDYMTMPEYNALEACGIVDKGRDDFRIIGEKFNRVAVSFVKGYRYLS